MRNSTRVEERKKSQTSVLKRLASSLAGSMADLPNNENIEVSHESSGIKQVSEFHINSHTINEHNLSSSRTSKMAMVLKIGTGGDQQEHVSQPRSIIKEEIVVEEKRPSPTKQQIARATSATIKLENRPNNNNFMPKAAEQKGSYQRRPASQYNNPSKTLKRIQSELETIQERKEDRAEFERDESNNQAPYENIMVDESYSFSLRHFEKQNSRIDLHISGGLNDLPRMSNLSAYGQGDQSGRNHSGIHSVNKKNSSKINLLGNSNEFGPFSKRRNNDRLQSGNSSKYSKPTQRKKTNYREYGNAEDIIVDIEEENEYEVNFNANKFSSHNPRAFQEESIILQSDRVSLHNEPDQAAQPIGEGDR